MSGMPTVVSEAGRLKKVVVHRPGLEWDLVPCGPGALAKYLIEDIFVLSRAQDEHDCFTKVLRMFIGEENVIEIRDLLVDVCKDSGTRREIIGAVTALESLGLKTADALNVLRPQDLADVLLRGAMVADNDRRANYENMFPPIPNIMFTRDIGVSIPNAFLVAHAATPARRRETLLMRYILRHPIFENIQKLDILESQNEIFWRNLRDGEAFSLEGGDILVLDGRTLFIGTGERTTEAAFIALIDILEEVDSPVTSVVRAVLPKERASMHLDTVVTAIDYQKFMAYTPVITAIDFELYRRPFKSVEKATFKDFVDVMHHLSWHKTEALNCGGNGDLFSSREQWTDGANLFAIAPGILLGYDRNEETADVLKQNGYRYIEPSGSGLEQLEKLADRFQKTGEVGEKILIGLPGSELSRARGGPRCMTMPLERDSVPRGAGR